MEEGVNRFGARTDGENHAEGGGNNKEVEEEAIRTVAEGDDDCESNSAIFVCFNEF